MPTTGQAPKIEAEESKSYQQQEIDLFQNIITTIETAPEIFRAVDVSERLKGHQQRKNKELKELKEKKNEIEVAIENLKSDFGSEDSFADLKKLEEYEIQRKAVLVAIPLIEEQLSVDSKFSKEVRRKAEDAEYTIQHVLNKINVQLQENIDAKVNDLLQTFSMYKAAVERVRTEQKLIPSRLLGYKTIKNIIPEVKGLEKLLSFDNAAMSGGIQIGLARGKEEAAHQPAVVEKPIENIFAHRI